MTQRRTDDAEPPVQPSGDAAPPAGPEAPARAHARDEGGLLVDVDALMSRLVARPRLCVLCGGPLRSGQHMLRVHGTTVHARCSRGR